MLESGCRWRQSSVREIREVLRMSGRVKRGRPGIQEAALS